MAKLTKQQARDHAKACELLELDTLNDDQKEFVLNNWHEGANHINGTAGAFFTPLALAFDMEFDFRGSRIIDLCAGIGALAYCAVARARHGYDGKAPDVTCIEINPDYVKIGQKIVPEATWICGDVTDPILMASLGHFDCAFGNPPFGKIKSEGQGPRYTNRNNFEYMVIDIASDIADAGTFIIPQQRAPFKFSGQPHHDTPENPGFDNFHHFTGIPMDCGIGVDTAYHADDWKDVKPVCEIVCCDFEEARANRAPAQQDLFAA
jgi:hypothetical protein